MTRYEELMNKHYSCLDKARNTTGLMSSIWLHHAFELEKIARSLPVTEAEVKQ